MNIYKEAGERILKIRNMRGYSRQYLADQAGISVKYLYEIEHGRKRFAAGVLYNLCHALDVDNDYILTGRERVECNQNLLDVLELFKPEQTKYLEILLKEVYKLSKEKKESDCREGE